MIDFQLAHESDVNYTDPEAFNPDPSSETPRRHSGGCHSAAA